MSGYDRHARLKEFKAAICLAECGVSVCPDCRNCILSKVTVENAYKVQIKELYQKGAAKPAEPSVLTCKNCKYYRPQSRIKCANDFGLPFCTDEDYCSNGERL